MEVRKPLPHLSLPHLLLCLSSRRKWPGIRMRLWSLPKSGSRRRGKRKILSLSAFWVTVNSMGTWMGRGRSTPGSLKTF